MAHDDNDSGSGSGSGRGNGGGSGSSRGEQALVGVASIEEWYYRQAGKAWRRRPHQRRGAAHRAACGWVGRYWQSRWAEERHGSTRRRGCRRRRRRVVWCGVVSRAARAVVYLGQQQRHMTWEWRGQRAEVKGQR
jgi:hypothetical protein